MGTLLEQLEAERARRNQQQAPDALSQLMAERERRQVQQPSQPAQAAQRTGPSLGEPGYMPEGATLLGTFPDNGRIWQMPDGTLGLASAGAVTTEQDVIRRVMDGQSFAEATLPGWQETAIQQHPVAARAATAIQGVPFAGEWADEAVGAMFGDTAQNAMRFSQEAMQAQRPGQTLGLQLGTGIAASVPLAMGAIPYVAKGAGLGGQMLRGGLLGAGAGAIEGAVSGAGEQDDRAGGALTRGAFGAGIGGFLGAGIPAVARGVGNFLRDPAERAAASGLGVSPPAARLLQRVLSQEDMGTATNAIRQAGRTAMPADAGPGPRGLIDFAMQRPETPSTFRNRITDRATEVYGDVTETLNRTMGEPRGLISVEDAIRKNAAPEIRAAYETAYSLPIDYSSEAGRAIENLLDRLPRATTLKAVNRANERMRFDGAPANQIMARISDDGVVTYQEMPNVMQLDYIKRAFNEIARDGTDNLTGKMSSDAEFASRIAREIRNATRDAVPEYGNALSLAADQLSQEAAVSFGARVLNRQVTREMVEREIKNATPPEIEAMRQALRSQIDERLANVRSIASNPGDAIEARQLSAAFGDMTSPAAREKMRVLLGEESAEQLQRSLREAAQALQLRADTAVNSRTAGRMAGQGLLDEITAPNALQTLAMGEPLNASKQVTQALTGISQDGMSANAQRILEEAVDVLTRSGQREAMDAVTIIKRAIDAKPVTERQAYQVSRAINAALSVGGYQQGSRTRLGLLQ
jgi:hypothetical protein